eukprot:gene5929-6169_t
MDADAAAAAAVDDARTAAATHQADNSNRCITAVPLDEGPFAQSDAASLQLVDQTQQQQDDTQKPSRPPRLAVPTLDRTFSSGSSGLMTPSSAGSNSIGTASPYSSSGGGIRQRRSFNTTRQQPSLVSTIASAAVAQSLQEQYHTEGSWEHSQQVQQQQLRSLPARCALLLQQHCRKLRDVHGESGETTALDIGCGAGGSCFELAQSFSHVIGIDSSAKHIVAAREIQEKGKLEFWKFPLPDLPPKLQPVDAVLVEDVGERLGPAGLQRAMAAAARIAVLLMAVAAGMSGRLPAAAAA